MDKTFKTIAPAKSHADVIDHNARLLGALVNYTRRQHRIRWCERVLLIAMLVWMFYLTTSIEQVVAALKVGL